MTSQIKTTANSIEYLMKVKWHYKTTQKCFQTHCFYVIFDKRIITIYIIDDIRKVCSLPKIFCYFLISRQEKMQVNHYEFINTKNLRTSFAKLEIAIFLKWNILQLILTCNETISSSTNTIDFCNYHET